MARGLAIDPKVEATKLLKNAAYGAHIVERRWPNVDRGDYRPVRSPLNLAPSDYASSPNVKDEPRPWLAGLVRKDEA